MFLTCMPLYPLLLWSLLLILLFIWYTAILYNMQSNAKLKGLLLALGRAVSPPPLATCFFYPRFLIAAKQAVKFKIQSQVVLCLFSPRFHPSPLPLTPPPSFSITILTLLSLLSGLLHAITCSLPFPSLPSLSVSSFQPSFPLATASPTEKQQ